MANEAKDMFNPDFALVIYPIEIDGNTTVPTGKST